MLQGWEIGIVGQIPTPTKPTQLQVSELAKETTEVQDEPACKPESQWGSDLTLGVSEDPQSTSVDEENDIVVVARRILTKNLNITQQMIEKLKANPGKFLRPEQFQMGTKLVETPF